MLKLTEAHM